MKSATFLISASCLIVWLAPANAQTWTQPLLRIDALADSQPDLAIATNSNTATVDDFITSDTDSLMTSLDDDLVIDGTSADISSGAVVSHAEMNARAECLTAISATDTVGELDLLAYGMGISDPDPNDGFAGIANWNVDTAGDTQFVVQQDLLQPMPSTMTARVNLWLFSNMIELGDNQLTGGSFSITVTNETTGDTITADGAYLGPSVGWVFSVIYPDMTEDIGGGMAMNDYFYTEFAGVSVGDVVRISANVDLNGATPQLNGFYKNEFQAKAFAWFDVLATP